MHTKRLFSALQPTGRIHLGNYIGALSLWTRNQELYDSTFCVVDVHALAIPESVNPSELRLLSRQTLAIIIACGVDPARSTIFLQSSVPAHSELACILNCVTPLQWLEQMTQFTSKAQCVSQIGAGLLTYPVQQAADILLYDCDVVPVGVDQLQHIALVRDIAVRFHEMFGVVFTLPEAMVRDDNITVMSLIDPSTKMSKSLANVSPGHVIGLVDPPEMVRERIMMATTASATSSEAEAVASPGVRNLLSIYGALTGGTTQEVGAHFSGRSHAFLKEQVSEVLIETLTPIRRRYRDLMDDPAQLETLFEKGAVRAAERAGATLRRVRDRVGVG
jgi:tryptophanyl-tRNA synthetase